MSKLTSIQIQNSTKLKLNELKEGNESYEKLIGRLIYGAGEVLKIKIGDKSDNKVEKFLAIYYGKDEILYKTDNDSFFTNRLNIDSNLLNIYNEFGISVNMIEVSKITGLPVKQMKSVNKEYDWELTMEYLGKIKEFDFNKEVNRNE